MTENEQNITIAEWCGWKHFDYLGPLDDEGWPRQVDHWELNGACMVEGPPNYCHDLNAMHEAEEKLIGGDKLTFCDNLDKITGCSRSEWEIVHATAAQRAEALLRTIGKWKD